MIFSQPLYGKVLRGEKTQTRRLALPSHPDTKYQAGKRIAVQKGRGVPNEGHILLTAVRRERLRLLDFDAARAEGFRTSLDFKTYWLGLHDAAWVEKLTESGEPPTDDEILDRFETRHGHRLVWVLTFKVDHSERPRLLAQRNARANYVEHPAQAMPREPEAVDAATQKLFAREGHQGFVAREAQREADRERLGLEERLRVARVEAEAAGVDVFRQEQAILRRIKAMENKARKAHVI